MRKATIRPAILACLRESARYLSAAEIARRTGIPYKSTIDALNALHGRAQVDRIGGKFTARWGTKTFPPTTVATENWELLAATWFHLAQPSAMPLARTDQSAAG